MSIITIEQPNTEAAAAESSALVAQARALTVKTKDECEAATLFLKRIAAAKSNVVSMFKEPKAAAHAAHKAITALEGKILAPLDEARQTLEPRIIAYQDEARRAAEAEQRRLESEARKAEEERALADAMLADACGDSEAAQAILAEPITTPTIAVAPSLAKVEGVATKSTWRAEVTDFHALVKFIAVTPAMLGLLSANLPAINALVRSQKSGMRIPGVRAVEERGLSVRA